MNCNDEPVDQCNPELSISCVIEGSKHLAINIKFPVTSLRNSTNFHCEFAPVHPVGPSGRLGETYKWTNFDKRVL